jgi:hypothetical protein
MPRANSSRTKNVATETLAERLRRALETRNYPALCDALVDKAKPNLRMVFHQDKLPQTPAEYTICHGLARHFLQALLEAGAESDLEGPYPYRAADTLLQVALEAGNEVAAQVLLDGGQEYPAAEVCGEWRSALRARHPHRGIAILLRAGFTPDPDEVMPNLFAHCICAGDRRSMRALLPYVTNIGNLISNGAVLWRGRTHPEGLRLLLNMVLERDSKAMFGIDEACNGSLLDALLLTNDKIANIKASKLKILLTFPEFKSAIFMPDKHGRTLIERAMSPGGLEMMLCLHEAGGRLPAVMEQESAHEYMLRIAPLMFRRDMYGKIAPREKPEFMDAAWALAQKDQLERKILVGCQKVRARRI